MPDQDIGYAARPPIDTLAACIDARPGGEMNRLRESGKPLFFKVANAAGLGIAWPGLRRDDAIRVHVRSLSVMQKEALVTSTRTGATWRLASDEGAYLDGDDEAPCPLSFLTTGMICSFMEEIRALARERGVEMTRIELVQNNYYTMKGSALRGTMTGGARDVELEARIETRADGDTVMRLLLDATAASPVAGLMHRALPGLFALAHNGRPLDVTGVAPIGPASTPGHAPALADSEFDAAVPAPGDFSRHIVRDGPSPKIAGTTGFAGSSLAEQQDRILHLRATCRLRNDGVKQVEQHLYNPHGSIFRFLCDEAPENGGRGAAPDALSYVSAGIAFCFMTQFGRYAKITRKDLRDYRIVQDTHFSRGGSGTGRAGEADPVATHVHLETGEDDEFARTALRMAEQTCFLHALCRGEIRTKVRFRKLGSEPNSGTSGSDSDSGKSGSDPKFSDPDFSQAQQ